MVARGMSASREDYRLTTLVVVSVLLIVSLITSAIDVNSVEVNGLPAVVWCAIIAFAVQWLAWIPASISQTERFYDLTGGLTYLAVVAFSLWAGSQSEDPSTREWLISALVAIWAIRLSSFLFLRIHEAGKDGRFDQLKTSPVRFLVPWTLQALWVFLTLNVVVVINSQSGPAPPLGIWDGIGLMVWIMGFGIEVMADSQKTAFEMVAWISPVFVYLLLTKVSGIPLLDRRSLAKWGDNPEYQNYRENTPALFPHLGPKR